MFSSKSSEETCIHIVCMDGTNISSSSPFFLHLFIIIFKCSCLCLLFSSCFSFIMFFVVLLMKNLCSGGKVKKYIYSTTFI